MHKIKSSHKIHWFIAIPGSKKLSLAATRSRSNFSLSSAQCTFQFLKFQSTLLHADREQENYWNMIIIQINFLLEYFLRSQKKAPEREFTHSSRKSHLCKRRRGEVKVSISHVRLFGGGEFGMKSAACMALCWRNAKKTLEGKHFSSERARENPNLKLSWGQHAEQHHRTWWDSSVWWLRKNCVRLKCN